MPSDLDKQLELLGSADEAARESAVAALENFGPPATSEISSLANRLSDANADVAYWAATLLGRASDDASGAVGQLASTLADVNRPLAVRERAAWALGKIGPATREALPQLIAAEKSGDARLARLATAARKSIEN